MCFYCLAELNACVSAADIMVPDVRRVVVTGLESPSKPWVLWTHLGNEQINRTLPYMQPASHSPHEAVLADLSLRSHVTKNNLHNKLLAATSISDMRNKYNELRHLGKRGPSARHHNPIVYTMVCADCDQQRRVSQKFKMQWNLKPFTFTCRMLSSIDPVFAVCTTKEEINFKKPCSFSSLLEANFGIHHTQTLRACKMANASEEKKTMFLQGKLTKTQLVQQETDERATRVWFPASTLGLPPRRKELWLEHWCADINLFLRATTTLKAAAAEELAADAITEIYPGYEQWRGLSTEQADIVMAALEVAIRSLHSAEKVTHTCLKF